MFEGRRRTDCYHDCLCVGFSKYVFNFDNVRVGSFIFSNFPGCFAGGAVAGFAHPGMGRRIRAFF